MLRFLVTCYRHHGYIFLEIGMRVSRFLFLIFAGERYFHVVWRMIFWREEK